LVGDFGARRRQSSVNRRSDMYSNAKYSSNWDDAEDDIGQTAAGQRQTKSQVGRRRKSKIDDSSRAMKQVFHMLQFAFAMALPMAFLLFFTGEFLSNALANQSAAEVAVGTLAPLKLLRRCSDDTLAEMRASVNYALIRNVASVAEYAVFSDAVQATLASCSAASLALHSSGSADAATLLVSASSQLARIRAAMAMLTTIGVDSSVASMWRAVVSDQHAALTRVVAPLESFIAFNDQHTVDVLAALPRIEGFVVLAMSLRAAAGSGGTALHCEIADAVAAFWATLVSTGALDTGDTVLAPSSCDACLSVLRVVGTTMPASCDELVTAVHETFEKQMAAVAVIVANHDATGAARVSTSIALLVVAVCMGLLVAFFVVRSQLVKITQLEEELAMRQTTTQAVQAFVPRELIDIIGLRAITEVRADDPRDVHLTVLSSDIRSFTSISEKFSDTELFEWLQEHIENMTKATRRHRGFVEKFIGDAILALFDSSADAVTCGIELQQIVDQDNVERVARGEENMVRIGVGIHTGSTLVGVLGDAETQNTAAVSSTVSLATKFEELTKQHGAKIITSVNTFREADLDLIDYRSLGSVTFEGKNFSIVEVFVTEDFAVKQYKHETMPDFEAAVRARDQGAHEEANAHFDKVIAAPKPYGYEDLAAVKIMIM
jgi:class 3 adenylate cyclase